MAAMTGTIHVLHVDDDPEFADLTARFIEREDEDIAVETVTRVDAALDRLPGEFNCIVSDYDMPGQSGIEFLKHVRGQHPELPFILFTGKGSEEVASEAISAGVTDYLQKRSGTSQYALLANRIRNAVERARASKAVQETEKWATTLLEHSSDYLFIVDEDGNTTYVSPGVERVLGYQPEEVLGMSAFETIHPDDIDTAAEGFAKTLETPEEEITVEFRSQHANGDYRWLEVRGRNLLDNPVIDGILVNARDITGRKERERGLEKSQERFRTIAESASDAILTIDTQSIVTYANPAVERIFGYEPTAVEGEPLTKLMPERRRDRHRAGFERYLDSGERSLDWTGIEFNGLHKDGHEIELEISFSELEWNGNHRFTGIIRESGN